MEEIVHNKHYELRLLKYIENFTTKNWKVSDEKLW